MDCVVLGHGGMMPMPSRFTTSALVRREGRMLMLDAGEGIQIAMKKGGVGIANLDAVAVTHLHADHVLGLPGVMMFRAQNDAPGPLTIVGPPGLAAFIESTVGGLNCYINYEYKIIEWSVDAGDTAWQWGDVRLIWKSLDHSCLCLGYRLEEAARPGRFLLEKAESLGVPRGPLYNRLQGGETVTLPGGGVVTPDQVLGPPRPGRTVVYATDTRPCDGLDVLLRGADLAVIEGMFTNIHGEEAVQKKHMTSKEAADAARRAGVSRTVLVHISPRYSRNDESVIENEARAVFDRVEVASPLGVYPVPLSD